MNIIYRIYKVTGEKDNWYSCNTKMITQDVMMVNSKEEFKEAMKLTFGEDLKFKNTKGLEPGDIFCSIISYNCYNAEEYVSLQEYKCSCCGRTFKTNSHSLIQLRYTDFLKRICPPLYEEKKLELESNTFYCSRDCQENHRHILENEFREYAKKNDIVSDEWASREDRFLGSFASGYIYMITKRSTKEFYVGKTNAVPMFRWVQHLKTERFYIDNIADYVFEILEVVKNKTSLNSREAYWIQKKYDENPELCLNIVHPKLRLDLEYVTTEGIADVQQQIN